MEDNGIRKPNDEQEGGADRRPNNSTNSANATDLVRDVGADSDGNILCKCVSK